MGLAEYGFALFIFLLACIFALLCKYLFGRTKSRLQALDEKEKKLLAFYGTLEEMMDEFNDSAVQANSELAQQIASMRNVAASLRNVTSVTDAQPEKTAVTATASSTVPASTADLAQPIMVPAAAALPPQPGAQSLRTSPPVTKTRRRNTAHPPQTADSTDFETPVFEVVGEAQPLAAVPPAQTPTGKTGGDRPARILALHSNGMDRLHIAKELSVTLSEVDLVLGIAGQR